MIVVVVYAVAVFVARLVCGQLRVAIATYRPQVSPLIVSRTSVDVVEDKRQRHPIPLLFYSTNGTPTLLLAQDMRLHPLHVRRCCIARWISQIVFVLNSALVILLTLCTTVITLSRILRMIRSATIAAHHHQVSIRLIGRHCSPSTQIRTGIYGLEVHCYYPLNYGRCSGSAQR